MSRQANADLHDQIRQVNRLRDAQSRAECSRTLKDRCRRFLRIQRYLPELAEALGTWPEFQGAEVLVLKVPAHPHHEQLLPEGKACGSCNNFKSCRRLEYATADQLHCDFLPSRYREGDSA